MQQRRTLRSDDLIMRSGKRRNLSSSTEEKKTTRTDKRGPVWDKISGERIVGVRTSKSGNRYEATIRDPIKKKYLFLGSFDTIQQASNAYNAKKKELDQAAAALRVKDSKQRAETEEEKCDQVQTQTAPDKSPRDLRKEIVSVKSSEYNGGGAMGFMIPDSHGERKVFLPVIDNHGFLIGKFSEGDVSVLDEWLFTQTSPEMGEQQTADMQIDEPETESSNHVSTRQLELETETSETDAPAHSKQIDVPKKKTKRKEAELDLPQPAKKKKKKKVETKKATPCANDALSSTFYDAECQSRWEIMISQRKILAERPSDLEAYEECGFTEYLNHLGLRSAATVYEEYNKELVQEFYSNLKDGNLDPNSEWYKSVYIRGKVVRFSGELINNLLGLPNPEDFETVFAQDFEVTDDEMLSEITGGFQSQWPAQGNAATSSLTSRYFCLYQLAVNCWIPSSNTTAVTREMAKLLYCIGTKTRMNLGLLIQESIVSQAVSSRETNSLPYPCIISALMRGENVKVKKSDAVVFTVPIKPNKRTFSTRIVKDLPWTPSEAGSSSTSADKVKEAKILIIDGKLATLRCQVAALEAERAKLIAADQS